MKIRLGVIQYENVIFCYNEKNNVSQQIFYIGKQTEYGYRYVYNTVNTVASVTFYNTTVQYFICSYKYQNIFQKTYPHYHNFKALPWGDTRLEYLGSIGLGEELAFPHELGHPIVLLAQICRTQGLHIAVHDQRGFERGSPGC